MTDPIDFGEGIPSGGVGYNQGSADRETFVGEDADSQESPSVTEIRKIAEHRRAVTLGLIMLLAVIIIGHYVAILALVWFGKDGNLDGLNNAFNASLPLVAGLVSSAVTYYFSKREKDSQ